MPCTGPRYIKEPTLITVFLLHFRNGLVCKYCNKVYYTQQNYDLHVAGHEGDEKGFRWCLVCGLKLRYHQHKYHMKKHRGPAGCFDCDQTFNNVEILRRHIKVRKPWHREFPVSMYFPFLSTFIFILLRCIALARVRQSVCLCWSVSPMKSGTISLAVQ